MKKTALLLIITAFAVLLSLKFGTIKIPWLQLFDPQFETIVNTIRLPRATAAFFVGACLALSGVVLQSILRNPLADSYTLGISGGSAVGASAAMHLVFLPSYFSVPGLSFLGSLLAVFFVLLLAGRTLRYESRTLILLGLMTSLFLGALSVFSISILPVEKNQSALSWLMGEFGSSRDSWVAAFFFIAVLPIAYLFKKSRTLDVLALGDVKALSLGFEPRAEKSILILIATLLTSLAIAISGLVGFIGLVSPHLARRFLKTSRHSNILPAATLIGGSLLLCADTLGRSLIPDREIPAGSLAALVGAPILIYLLLEKSHAQDE